ncbi:MAG: hypothetical protein HC840_00345 [Leptolyngbyaceae cyanobacterium RM2_2_4]|nr:hypothetical protein [Leptolyngbyaceae cyanobacterium RM2_2_4]
MKKIIVALMVVCLLPLQAFAECDFGTGIAKVEGGYLYTRECHLKVGEMKYDLGVKDLQIEKLTKALDLKDLAITKADQRADMWMNTAYKLEDRINTIDNMRQTNQWIAFGLGVVTMFAASYAASQLIRH